MKMYKILFSILIGACLITGCRKYLDVNSDPSSPQEPDLAALMLPVTGAMSKMQILDVITVSQYNQNFSHVTAGETFDVHGGNAGGASANALWRSFYAQPGASINLIIKKGILEERWDYVGAAHALRAWGMQMTTDYFGEMPYTQAWDLTRATFAYDNQERIYNAIDSLCLVAISYLQRDDGGVNSVTMARGDQVYRGDRNKWIKFVWGLRARNWHRLTNKPNYNADSVIDFVNKSFSGNTDNFYIIHTASKNDNTSPTGPARDNFTVRRPSKFSVQLLDGTIFFGTPSPANRDPRLKNMFSVSPDTTVTNQHMPSQNGGYRFLTPGVGDPNTAALPVNNSQGIPTNPIYRQRPSTVYADSAIVNPALNNFTAGIGKFLFQNKADIPIMTYHELQFIKAEAAFRKGDAATAHIAYKNGITAHFDFVNKYSSTSSPTIPSITTAQRDAYMASAAVKQTPALLTVSDIMLQKYIGDWGWNFVESWSDMRRYHYYDLDPATGFPVYKGIHIITLFSSNNQGPKLAYRYRPTNFSEFDWNFEELRKLGANNIDYHTYEMWFSKP